MKQFSSTISNKNNCGTPFEKIATTFINSEKLLFLAFVLNTFERGTPQIWNKNDIVKNFVKKIINFYKFYVLFMI